jgi:hypothetical protein
MDMFSRKTVSWLTANGKPDQSLISVIWDDATSMYSRI